MALGLLASTPSLLMFSGGSARADAPVMALPESEQALKDAAASGHRVGRAVAGDHLPVLTGAVDGGVPLIAVVGAGCVDAPCAPTRSTPPTDRCRAGSPPPRYRR